MEIKICKKCNLEFPATSEYFYKQKNGKFGFNSKCKKCTFDENKIHRSKPEVKQKHRLEQIQWRVKNHEKAKEINRKSYDKNKKKYNDYKRNKYINDEEYRLKCIERDRKYNLNGKRKTLPSYEEQKEKNRIRRRKRYYSNIEREKESIKLFNLKNPEYMKQKSKERSQKLPDKYLFYFLKQKRKLNIKFEEMPKEILEVTRNIILLKRELKTN